MALGLGRRAAALLALTTLPLCSSFLEGSELAIDSPAEAADAAALVEDDECAASAAAEGGCGLHALQLRARRRAAGDADLEQTAEDAKPPAPHHRLVVKGSSGSRQAPPCLCVFDIDRTLTSKQGSASNCLGTKNFTISDTAYGGGNLTLSELSVLGINTTFCNQCYLGLCSAGDGSGPHSLERELLLSEVVLSEPQKELYKIVPEAKAWTLGPVIGNSTLDSPYVIGQPDGKKQLAIEAIIRWYANLGINIPPTQAYLFDDRASNVMPFVNVTEGLTAVQISCASRDKVLDNAVGYCGGVPQEITPPPPGTKVKLCAAAELHTAKGATSGTKVGSPEAENALLEQDSQPACPEKSLVGTWKVENALGIAGITVVLTVHPSQAATCGSLDATINFVGQEVHYVVTVRPAADGTLSVRYTNQKAQPVYFHEGTYDVKADKLTEDLTHVDGKPAPSGGLSGVLRFDRARAAPLVGGCAGTQFGCCRDHATPAKSLSDPCK